MELNNYTSSKSHWLWTGYYTLNQIWSYFYVSEPILVDRIDVYWGGYDAPTRGRHFIAKWGGNGKLTGLVAKSSLIDVPQGRAWRSASISPVLLEPGSYAVGIWGVERGRRTVGMWNGDGSQIIYLKNKSELDGTTDGNVWNGKWTGVIPCRLIGESAGRVWIRSNGSWRKGQVFVKVNNTWRKAKGVFQKINGSWRRSK